MSSLPLVSSCANLATHVLVMPPLLTAGDKEELLLLIQACRRGLLHGQQASQMNA